MSEKGILFSAPMVQALLAGRKTQTRRLIEPITGPIREGDILVSWPDDAFIRQGLRFHPRIKRGERLWVRESFRLERKYDGVRPTVPHPTSRVWYEVDRDNCDAHGKLRPSLHMPRWASRLTLTVTDVRVQRVQDISEADCLAEGIELNHKASSPVIAYETLWNLLHTKPGERWDDDPWIYAVTFDVEKRNIDAGEAR